MLGLRVKPLTETFVLPMILPRPVSGPPLPFLPGQVQVPYHFLPCLRFRYQRLSTITLFVSCNASITILDSWGTAKIISMLWMDNNMSAYSSSPIMRLFFHLCPGIVIIFGNMEGVEVLKLDSLKIQTFVTLIFGRAVTTPVLVSHFWLGRKHQTLS